MLSLVRNIVYGFFGLINKVIFRFNKIKKSYPKVNGLIILINKGGSVQFGKNCIINSHKYKNIIGGDTRSSIVVEKDAIFFCGDNLRMSNSAINCSRSIKIGNNVMIGGGCKIWDSDFHPISSQQRLLTPNSNYKSKEIYIGDNVFIGGGSIILKGVSIGENSVIGAGSVVSKSIPPNEIWAGNPAMFLKKNDV